MNVNYLDTSVSAVSAEVAQYATLMSIRSESTMVD